MSPENGTILKGASFSNSHFQGAMLALGGVVFLCYEDPSNELLFHPCNDVLIMFKLGSKIERIHTC